MEGGRPGRKNHEEITHFVTFRLNAQTPLLAAQPSPDASPRGAAQDPAPRRNITQAGRVCGGEGDGPGTITVPVVLTDRRRFSLLAPKHIPKPNSKSSVR